MCGIAGILSFGQPVVREDVARMTSALAHRGPDDEGIYIHKRIGLGHRRLSIIDIEGGHQPMASADGALQIVYNGELYNYPSLRSELTSAGYSFRTRSDTEVVLAAYATWGEDSLQRLNGIYAFAIWDSDQEILFIARDPLGVKPLYYHVNNERLLFGSELKALLTDSQVHPEVDTTSLSLFLTFRYVPSPRTMIRSIRKLPPGNCLKVHNGNVRLKRYWVRPPVISHNIDPAEAEAEYARLLDAAVERQLISDVPVGLFLSGGVDSSLLLALMQGKAQSRIKTFTVGFPGTPDEDESDAASSIALSLGAENERVVVGAQDYGAWMEEVTWCLEEPVSTTSIVPYYFVAKAAAESLKVVLTGQGADEPWGGYTRHVGEKLGRYARLLPMPLRVFAAHMADQLPIRGEVLRRGLRSLVHDDEADRFTAIYALFTDSERQMILKDEIVTQVTQVPQDVLQPYLDDVPHLDSLGKMFYTDTRTWLPDDLLLYGDKLAMAHGLEARVPFLDLELLQFVESLPTRLKLKGLTGKYLHKRVARRLLPNEIVRRRKKGFTSPVDSWLRDEMRESVREKLLDSGAGIRSFMEPKAIDEILLEHASGRRNRQRQIFALLAFEVWFQVFCRGVAR